MLKGKNAISKWVLNGQTINAPKEWQTAEVLATFDNDAIQASMSIDKFTFVYEEATKLIQHITNGMTGGVGITEGIPFKLQLENDSNNVSVFDGMINLFDNVEINEFKNTVSCKIKLRDELFSLEEKLQSLSFGYLKDIGVITSSDYTDVHYVVQKKVNILETIIMSITLYMMTKELIDTIIKINKDIGLTTADGTGGLPLPTAPLASIILGIVILVLQVLYTALLLVAIIKLSSTMLSQLIPINRKAKTIKFKTALTKVCSHLGYGFNSNITDLDNVVYLPSNYNYDIENNLGIITNFIGNSNGIPSSTDYGYSCIDFFELAKKLFNGKYAIINGVVNFHNVDDLFWNQYSTFQMPNIREKVKTYNTDELKANRYIVFDVDYSDEWTIDDYLGTAYEVITTQQISNDSKLVQLQGLDEIRIGACLGSRKYNVSGFETYLLELAGVVDSLITMLGGQAIYVQMVNTSVGLMRISTNNWQKPKVLKIDSNKKLVPRSQWGAKYIYDNYYVGKSFVATVNGMSHYGQKEIYNNVRIPFGLNNFVTLVNNSYFTLPDGTPGKVISCKYRFSADTAIVDYYIRKPYTTNLQEYYVEPSNQ